MSDGVDQTSLQVRLLLTDADQTAANKNVAQRRWYWFTVLSQAPGCERWHECTQAVRVLLQ